MKPGEIFVFHGCKYRVDIRDRQYLPDSKLRQNIYRKRRTITTSSASFTASFALCFVTFGAGLIGCALSARSVVVATKKLDLLEAEWLARGQKKLPTRVFKDIILPIGLAQAVGCIADDVFDDNDTQYVVAEGDDNMKDMAGSVFEGSNSGADSDPPEYEEVGGDASAPEAPDDGDTGADANDETDSDNGDDAAPTEPLVDVSVPDDADGSSVPVDSQPGDAFYTNPTAEPQGSPDLSGLGQDTGVDPPFGSPVDAGCAVDAPVTPDVGDSPFADQTMEAPMQDAAFASDPNAMDSGTIDQTPAFDSSPDTSAFPSDAPPTDIPTTADSVGDTAGPSTDLSSPTLDNASAPTAPDSQLSQMAQGFVSGTESLLTTGGLPVDSSLSPAAVIAGEALAVHAAHMAVEKVLHYGAGKFVNKVSEDDAPPPPPPTAK